MLPNVKNQQHAKLNDRETARPRSRCVSVAHVKIKNVDRMVIVILPFFLYSFRVISDSGFQMFLYAIGIYPLLCLLVKLGGHSMVRSF
jgi:hypothetical protein